MFIAIKSLMRKRLKQSQFLRKLVIATLFLGFFSVQIQAYHCSQVFQSPYLLRTAENLQKNYPEAAALILPHVLMNLKSRIEHLQKNDFEPKAAAQVRKLILEVRFVMEVFAPSFAKQTEKDPWYDMWRELKKGYSLIGSFRAIPKKNIEKRKKAMLKVRKWAEQLLDQRFDQLTKNMMDAHSPQLQSRQFPRGMQWDAELLRPSTDKPAFQVFRELSLELVSQAKTELPKLLKIKDLIDHNQSKSFHNFRKQLRTAIKITDFTQPGVTTRHPHLKQFLYDMGKINDKIERLQKQMKKNELTSAEKHRKESQINELWNQFLQNYSQQEMSRALQDFSLDI